MTAAKYVANVRQLRTSSSLLLLQTDTTLGALQRQDDSEGGLRSAGILSQLVNPSQV